MEAFSARGVELDGVNLVEASAGTGKTHAITTLLLRLLIESERTLDQILVVTFTEAATAELRARIRGRLVAALMAFEGRAEPEDDDVKALLAGAASRERAAARLRLALTTADQAAVHTIHGFCHRALLDSAFSSRTPYDAELLTDVSPVRDELVCDFFARELHAADEASVRVLTRAGLSPAAVRSLAELVTRNPAVPLLPAMPAEHAAPDGRALIEAFEAARAVWDRASVERLLGSDALHGRRYARHNVRRWCEAIELHLAAGLGDHPAMIEGLERCRTSVLALATKRGRRPPSHPFFDACERLALAAREHEAAAERHALAFRLRLADALRRGMPARMARLGALSFDDLLLRLAGALEAPGGERLAALVRSRHPVALIDEFQDTDPVQAAIFSAIYPAGTLFLIGDPKQAIYGFRGADVFAYLGAAARVPSERRFTMTTNWRSDRRLVSAVSALFRRPAAPFVLSGIGLPEVQPHPGARDAYEATGGRGGAALAIAFVPREGSRPIAKTAARQAIPRWVAARIAQLLDPDQGARIDGRSLRPADVAVLTRTNAEAFSVQAALRTRGIVSVVLGDRSVLSDEQPEAAELERILRAVAEPTRTGLVRTALTTELFGVSARELVEMESRAEAGVDAPRSWDWWIERFREAHRRWSQRGFVQMMRPLLEETGVFARLMSRPDGERRMTNVLHLVELLQSAASTQHLGPAALIAWLNQQRRGADRRAEAAQIRLESDVAAVTITTVHKSKGLEYPVVVCPYLWDGRLLYREERREPLFHDPDDDSRLKLDLQPAERPAALARAELERLAENLRLCYVALTRAKHHALLLWGAFADFVTSALGYVLHPPPLGGSSPSVDDVRSHLTGLSDARMLSDLEGLAHELGGALSVEKVSLAVEEAAPPIAAPEAAMPRLAARRVERPIERWWRVSSFTQLAAGRADPGEGRDRDEHTVAADPAPAGVSRAIRLAGFVRGPRAGTFFHEVLEGLDFASPLGDFPAFVARVEAKLAAYGYPTEQAEEVAGALVDVLRTPLVSGRDGFRLMDIATDQRIDEMEFYLPVAGAVADRPTVPRGTQLSLGLTALAPSAGERRLSARRLAAVLADHPSPALAADYPERLAGLGFAALDGFLKGYIDLVFTHRSRWYLVDYKTNHLGDEIAAYARERLPAAMSHGHYYLQYHLYTVALHRYLGRRLRGYRYERDFGGVLYLFLKGMDPELGPRSGVFFERPPRARIEALDELLSDRGEGGP